MKSSLLGSEIGSLGVPSRGQAANIADYHGLLGATDNTPAIDISTPQVMNPTHIFVMSIPTMFQNYPVYKRTLKEMIETMPKQVTGIDFEYALETQKHPAGRDGQELDMPTRSTRSQISPSFVYNDVAGGLVFNMNRVWITNISHPDTGSSYYMLQEDGYDIPPHMYSSFSMSVMAIQFDPTMRADSIIDAGFITAMFPKNSSALGLEKNITSAKISERTIPYTGVMRHNDTVRDVAYVIADAMQMHKNHANRLPIGKNGIDADIAGLGIAKQLEEIRAGM